MSFFVLHGMFSYGNFQHTIKVLLDIFNKHVKKMFTINFKLFKDKSCERNFWWIACGFY